MSITVRSLLILAAVSLAACDVQIRDETPDQYTANHDIGLYEVKATVTDRGFLVSPTSVFLSAISCDRTIELQPDRSRTTWSTLMSVRCRSSFPLQFRAVWTVQNVSTRGKLVPPQPREIRLIEPEWTREAKQDTSQRSRTGWTTAVRYRVQTEPNVEITAARIEPVSDSPEDVKAAEPLSVTTQLPVMATCGDPVEITVHSKAQRAYGNLVIETTHPTVKTWQTRVEFAPL